MVENRGAQILDNRDEREAWLEKIQFLSDAMESTSQPFCAADRDGSILIFNEAFCRLTGYTRDELYDINWITDLTVPESLENDFKAAEVLDQTRQPQRYEKSYRRKDGTVVPVELLVDLASDSKGRPLFYYAFITDITERKRADEALRESEEMFRAMADSSYAAILIHQGQNYIYANKAASYITGYSIDQLLSMPFWCVFHPDMRELVRNRGLDRLRGKLPSGNYEVKLLASSGETRWALISSAQFNYHRQPSIIFTLIDITERKRAADALQESEEKFRALAETVPVGIMLFRMDKYIFTNPYMQNILGYSKDELLATNFWDVVHPDFRELTRVRGHERLQGLPAPSRYEIKVITKGGETRWGDFSAALIKYGGQPTVIGAYFDITERKRAEESLIESEERYRELVNMSPDAVLVHRGGIILYANPAAVRLHGATGIEQLLGRNILDFILPGDRQMVTDRIREIEQGEDIQLEELRIIRLDGWPVDVESSARLIHYGGEPAIQAIIRDITQRKLAENELRESEENFRALAESSTAAIFVIQGERYVTANQAAASITGYSKDELLKRSIMDIIHPDFKDIVQSRALARQRGEPVIPMYEAKIVSKTGEVKWVTVSAARIIYRGKPAEVATLVDITERKLVEEDRKRLIRDMGKRMKELRALYGAYEIIRAGESVSETLQEIVNIIPLAWQYPEVTAARISLNGQEYKTSNFSKTPWVQRVDFSTIDGERGAIEVYYLKARPNETEGPFLSEERALINSLAKMLRIFLDKRYAEKALLKAKTQAELYLDLLGHDITNMNQALVGNLEMLEMMSETGEIDRGLIDSSLETINRSSRTIRDVKKLTQVETGNVPQKVVDVCEILSAVKSRYSAVPDRLVTINYTPGEDCLIKAGDMLEDVFDNLVDNAIRHSRGAVTIDLTVDQVIDEGRTYFRITVADTGPGIPDALKKRIFMPLEELGGKAIRRGLGIYLVRTLVDYYHGKVWVEDRVQGDYTKGARFVVMLPAIGDSRQ